MKHTFECWDFSKMRFTHYYGRSRSHSRKIARERGDFERLSQPSIFLPPSKTAIEVRGTITFNRAKGSRIRYSLPPRQPRIFRGHK